MLGRLIEHTKNREMESRDPLMKPGLQKIKAVLIRIYKVDILDPGR